MAVTYYISVTLALFAGALPAQILGVIWEMIGESMTVEIPYIALLRLLGSAGAVAAVILSDRIRGYILARDLIVGAVALEAMSLIGFSMSREFWNLAVWITALGFSLGLCMTLICYLLRGTWSKKTSLLFAASACGMGAGVFFVQYTLSLGRSWRTACQGLAILQVVLCMSVFLLRRTLLRDVAVILKKQKRERGIQRQKRAEELIRKKGSVDERFEEAWLIRLLFLYGSAVSCGLLLLSAAHLTYSAQAAQQNPAADLAVSVLTVCAGMAAGRIVIGFLRINARRACLAGSVLSTAVLAVCFIMVQTGQTADWIVLPVRAGCGFGAGMIFPNLIQLDDERFDEEAQTGMAGLIPAFYFGADAMITPFVQSISRSFTMSACTLAMLALSCCMGLCIILATARMGRR